MQYPYATVHLAAAGPQHMPVVQFHCTEAAALKFAAKKNVATWRRYGNAYRVYDAVQVHPDDTGQLRCYDLTGSPILGAGKFHMIATR